LVIMYRIIYSPDSIPLSIKAQWGHNDRLPQRGERKLFRATKEGGSALVEFAISAPLFALLIYGVSQIALLSLWKYQLLMVTHAVMREAVGGTTDAGVLTNLANGYAQAGGLGRSGDLAGFAGGSAQLNVSIEPAGCIPGGNSGGMAGTLAAKFSPGVRLRVRTSVPLSGFLGRIWRNGFPLESSVVVLPDPWKGCIGWLKSLVGVDK